MNNSVDDTYPDYAKALRITGGRFGQWNFLNQLRKCGAQERRTSSFHGIHRDDGMVIFKNKWTVKQIDYWIKSFQLKVNDPCGDEDLQFTISIWNPDNDRITKYNKCTEIYDLW